MNSESFESLLSQALDRDLSPEEFAVFEQHLIKSPEARARYMEYVDLHVVLDLELQKATLGKPIIPAVMDAKNNIRLKKRSLRRAVLLSAAAMLIIGLVTMRLFSVDDQAPLLSFKAGPSTQFTLIHPGMNETHEGRTLEKGSRLELSQGSVELTFKSGVTSIVMAPADITLYDEAVLFLRHGAAWFKVPKGAEGFNVKTRASDIVDHGTEFGVFAHVDGYDEVHVFKGKVAARALSMKEEATFLTANEARRIDSRGELTVVKAEIDTFLTDLPRQLPKYSGPIELTEGTHTLGKGGVAYTVSASLSITDKPIGNEVDLVMHAADHISIVFSEAVDLKISPPQIPAGKRFVWNSDDDFGTLTLSGDAQLQVHDPNQEIEVEPLSQHAFRWKFLRPNESKFRTPALQSWWVALNGVREFVMSKDTTSKGRAAFDIMVTQPST